MILALFVIEKLQCTFGFIVFICRHTLISKKDTFLDAICSKRQNSFRFILTLMEPDSGFVRLISSDGFEFVIEKRCAMASGTIKALLSSPGRFTESHQNLVEFKDISALVLERVCQYLYYNVRYANSVTEIPDFKFPPEIALELLMAADFLDC